MMPKQVSRPDLAYLDALVLRAGATTKRLARGRKWYRSAVRTDGRPLSESRACRHYQGDRHSPAGRVLFALEQLARGEGTTPWPLIAEGIATVLQAEIRDASTAALEARLLELDDREHDLEAVENRTTVRAAAGEAYEAAALADIREAEVQLERAAIRRELADRARRA